MPKKIANTIPADLNELMRDWDRWVVAAIYKFSGGSVRRDDLEDLKQAVYLRVHETDYLNRCRVLIGERGGKFSTYLYLLVRSVLVNTFERNSREPLNRAVGIVQRRPGSASQPYYRVRVSTDALILETYKDLVDDRLERQQAAAEWLTQFARHLERVRPHVGPVVTLPDGTRAPRSLSLAFRLWCQLKETYGRGWPAEMARILGVSEKWVFALMKKIRLEAVVFLTADLVHA